MALARVTPADVERWHGGMRWAGVGEGALRNGRVVLRAALAQAVRWGWLTINPVSVARLMQRRRAPRQAMSVSDVASA
jgi:hypothetical protein